jgi:hypothetical protein
MTLRARPIFTVKQYAESHQPWICIEYWNNDPGMPMHLYGFDLEQGISFEKAKEIAQYMNDNLKEFTYTK